VVCWPGGGLYGTKKHPAGCRVLYLSLLNFSSSSSVISAIVFLFERQ
jgi:hypothetical protein